MWFVLEISVEEQEAKQQLVQIVAVAVSRL